MLPGTITKIGDNAFENSELGEIVLPAAVEMIGEEAFKDADAVIRLSADNKLEEIGESAFNSRKLMIYVPENGFASLADRCEYPGGDRSGR